MITVLVNGYVLLRYLAHAYVLLCHSHDPIMCGHVSMLRQMINPKNYFPIWPSVFFLECIFASTS